MSGTTDVTVSANLSELSDNTEYHYRVVATNSKGTTNGSDQSFTTLQAGSAPTATTDASTSITINSVTLNGTVNPGDLSTTVIFEYGTTDSYGSQITAAESPVSGMTDVSVSASLTGLEDGTTYHYRVTATNSIGTEYGSDQTFETEVNYPTTYSLSTTQSFPTKASAEDYLATDYRLFGLPGNSNELIRSHLSGNQGENWEVYLDNGEASNYLVKYDGGNNFRLSTGKGFWMIHKGNVGVNKSVSTAVLNSNNEVEIPLQDGWNIITNPLNVAMDWDVIKTYNQITEPIWKYEGSFSQSTDFQPYKGYYFYNSGNLSVLKFYYKPASLAKSVAENAESGWQITLQLLEMESGATISSLASGKAPNPAPIASICTNPGMWVPGWESIAIVRTGTGTFRCFTAIINRSLSRWNPGSSQLKMTVTARFGLRSRELKQCRRSLTFG